MHRIVKARPLKDYQLELSFDDGKRGIVDLQQVIPFDGVFASLRNRTYFGQVKVETDFGTVYWPNGADLDPDVLYSVVTGSPVPS